MLTDTQVAKVTSAIQPLYADADFANVSDMNVAVTSTPTAPQPTIDQVDVTKP